VTLVNCNKVSEATRIQSSI